MGKPKYDYKGSVHHFKKRDDEGPWGWIIGSVVILVLLASCAG